MKLIPTALLGADDDYWESFRGTYYPKLHPYLTRVGGYGVGRVTYDQKVGTAAESEEAIEAELVALGFERNPIACYKSLPDGRESEGSWVLRHEANPDTVDEGMQLHVTLFAREDSESGRELYAHYEDDWRAAPLAHLHEKNFDAVEGVQRARDLFRDSSFLVLS